MAQELPDFGDRDAVRAWLEGKPRSWSVVLAARSALRVLPLLEGLGVFPKDFLNYTKFSREDLERARSSIILAVFRASLVSWLCSIHHSSKSVLERAASRTADAASFSIELAAHLADYSRGQVEDIVNAAAAAAYSAASARNSFMGEYDVSPHAASAESATQYTDYIGDRRNTRADAASLSAGVKPSQLASRPLWPEANSIRNTRSWPELRAKLFAATEGWEVWVAWYEARLRGEPADLALWEKVVLIPDADWEQGPAHVNALIARIIAEHEAGKGTAGAAVADTSEPPALPIELPSPAHFEFRDGAVRPSPRPPTSPPNVATESAWRGVKESLDDFADRGGGGEVGVRQVVARCRAAMGERFADLDVTLLGVHAGRLAEFARRADEVLLAEDAADLVALDRALSVFVTQFEAWRAYVAAIEAPFAEPKVEQKAVDNAAAAIEAVRHAAPEIIAPETMEILDPLREAAQRHPSAEEPAPLAPALQRRSYLRAAGSLLLSIGEQLVADTREGVSKGVQKSAEGATVAAIGGAAAYLVALATGLPSEFAWLGALASYALRLLGRSS